MPRTNPKPLTILVIDEQIWTSPACDKFRDKGHCVYYVLDHLHDLATLLPTVDVIIGPTCWRIDPRVKLGADTTQEESLLRQMEMMEKGSRAVKFPKEVPHVIQQTIFN